MIRVSPLTYALIFGIEGAFLIAGLIGLAYRNRR